MCSYVPNDGIEDVDDTALERITGRQGIIYLIDVGKYEHSPGKSIVQDEERFRLCLDCIEEDLLKNILVNPKLLVSVVFYNTVHSPAPSQQFNDNDGTTTVVPSNCALFIPLKPISRDLIQYFKNFKQSEDLFDFQATYGSFDGSSFSEALWLCSRLIMQSSYKVMSSEIVLATNNELPHPATSQECIKALERAKDLRGNSIGVYMLPMADEFDYEPFYKNFLCEAYGAEEDEFQYRTPNDQRQHLLLRRQRGSHSTSCLRHLNFELADGLAMACDLHSLSRTAKKPATVKMFRSNNEIVIGKRYYYVVEQSPDDDSFERKVLPGEMFRSQTVCAKEIQFAPDEFSKMKSIQSPGLRLIGFKPMEELKPRWMIKHCLFLYPNEPKMAGSTVLFRSLWEKCMEKQKYALCTLTIRHTTLPK